MQQPVIVQQPVMGPQGQNPYVGPQILGPYVPYCCCRMPIGGSTAVGITETVVAVLSILFGIYAIASGAKICKSESSSRLVNKTYVSGHRKKPRIQPPPPTI